MKTDCETCKHNDKNWDELPCDGCCTAHSGYEEDAISRQAVLEPYKNLNDCDVIAVWLIRKNIEQQPSIKPKTGHWIPVSERFPNNDDYVLVCYEDGHIRTAYYYIDTNIYPSEFDDCCETGWYNYSETFMYKQDVIAWMPLPEPYKAESEE